MSTTPIVETDVEVSVSSAASEDAASKQLAAEQASAPPKAEEPKPDPRLDGQGPGEVFARHCPACGTFVMTADQRAKTPCRRCRVKAGEPYEAVALPPAPKAPQMGLPAPANEVDRVDKIPQ